MTAHHILIIEDNSANLELAQYLLETHGFTCESAMDGASALRCASARVPDLVLCDLQLPDIDGFEVLRSLRAMPSMQDVPVVAVTAYAMVGDRERVLGAGFDGYIAKPLDPTKFVGQVTAFLAGPDSR
ncbi:MAG: response regulator [Pseudomonadota bacterium]